MASKNIMLGTGAALAGIGGIAAAAVTVNPSEPTHAAAAQPADKVETRTVVVRTVEHRVKRIKAKHVSTVAPTTAATPAPQPAPVVQVAPTPAAAAAPTTANTAPIRTRASGGSGSSRGDENEHGGHGSDDAAEHADD